MKINSEQQYKREKKKLEHLEEQRKDITEDLTSKGYNQTQIDIALMAINKIYFSLKYDIEMYEKAKQGDFDQETVKMSQLESFLIKMRVYKGITQEQLAEKLGVSQVQISKDEKFEYQGIGTTKLNRILQVLGIDRLTIISKEEYPPQYYDWLEKQKALQEMESIKNEISSTKAG
ncbi:helix-turn-helix domain-containing protein [Shimazuella kribbensis]|uniref:helix-turn-helix domain-containing protein n=1 Tax=Shimazuella kribbensis TaxID=139808 RepID=UPI0003F84E72|nr:helix-turn-helix domain-containing protein [Shimazuella kribbensis]